MNRHPRVVLLVVLVLILAVLASRTLGGQVTRRSVTRAMDVRAAAANTPEFRVIVSLSSRRLWVLSAGSDTLLAARVAVGSGKTLRAAGRSWTFDTPRGIRSVESKETDPVWVRPDWSYVEAARENHLRLDSVSAKRPRALPDGQMLVVRGSVVGVAGDSATFEPVEIEDEIVFGSVLYIPPIDSDNRRMAGELGRYRLNLGDGIGLHGTPNAGSIGRAVTHGCLRLADDDLEWVFNNVPVGTRVFIY